MLRWINEHQGLYGRWRGAFNASRPFQGALAADAATGADDDIGMPAGADGGASTGVGGALATTDAEGSDGSEAGVVKALAGAVLEEGGGAPS